MDKKISRVMADTIKLTLPRPYLRIYNQIFAFRIFMYYN